MNDNIVINQVLGINNGLYTKGQKMVKSIDYMPALKIIRILYTNNNVRYIPLNSIIYMENVKG